MTNALNLSGESKYRRNGFGVERGLVEHTRKTARKLASALQRLAVLRLAAVPLAMIALAGGALIAADASLASPSPLGKQPVSLAARGGIGSFTPASVDPRLAAHVQALAGNHKSGAKSGDVRLFRFTPASADGEQRRAVTVAVRVDRSSARAVSVRSAAIAVTTPAGRSAPLKITPAAYNLGVARGFKGFAQPNLARPNLVLPSNIRPVEMPDLSAIERLRKPSQQAERPSRFNPRIALEEARRTGREPGTLEGGGASSVDVGGSYKLSRNLDVTAGVRYSRDRDRIAPLTDDARDNQAVYVGTQFRF